EFDDAIEDDEPGSPRPAGGRQAEEGRARKPRRVRIHGSEGQDGVPALPGLLLGEPGRTPWLAQLSIQQSRLKKVGCYFPCMPRMSGSKRLRNSAAPLAGSHTSKLPCSDWSVTTPPPKLGFPLGSAGGSPGLPSPDPLKML